MKILTILLGAMIAMLWQLGFSSVSSFFLTIPGSQKISNDFLTVLLFIQSFLTSAIPAFVIVYLSKLSITKCAYILLASIIIFTVVIEIWIGGLSSVIGLVLSLSAWIFIMGAITGCVSASILKS